MKLRRLSVDSRLCVAGVAQASAEVVARAAREAPVAGHAVDVPQGISPIVASSDAQGAEEQQRQQPMDRASLTADPVDGAFLRISSEALAARARGIPIMPDLEARRAHRHTHRLYRAWCTWCVVGRGREEPHRRVKREHTMPVVGLDYFFPAIAGHEPLTVLAVVEIYSGAVESILVDVKGPAGFAV